MIMATESMVGYGTLMDIRSLLSSSFQDSARTRLDFFRMAYIGRIADSGVWHSVAWYGVEHDR